MNPWNRGVLWISWLSASAFAQSAPIDPPCPSGTMAAEVAAHGEVVILSWLEPVKARGFALRFSRLEDNGEPEWSAPRTIVEGREFMANWADFPSVIPGPDGVMLAHWLSRSKSGAHAYDIQLARSTDGGETWSRLGKLHDDDTATEHGFVSVVPAAAGFEAVWLDGRGMASGGTMTLSAAMVDEGPGEATVLDADVCTCCQTDAVRTDAGLVAVYRDHTEDEIRDISIVRRTGDGWSEPRSVHDDGWRIRGCPVNGPAVAAGDGHLAVAWFTAAQDRPRVLLALSHDGGASFEAPLEIDGDRPIGRVAVVATDTGVLVSWLGRSADAAGVCLRRVSWDGEAGARRQLGATGATRASGFPRMARSGDRVVLVWLDTTAPSRLRAALISLAE